MSWAGDETFRGHTSGKSDEGLKDWTARPQAKLKLCDHTDEQAHCTACKLYRAEVQRDNCRTAALEAQAQVHEWRAYIEAHNAKLSPYEAYNTQHWCWMPGEENYLETLSAPVLIPAEALRALLEEAYERGKQARSS